MSATFEGFDFIHELYNKVHDGGYEPTQEDIEECARIMQIIIEALRPVMEAMVDIAHDVVHTLIDWYASLPEEIREGLKPYMEPMVVIEEGVDKSEPEPEARPHFSEPVFTVRRDQPNYIPPGQWGTPHQGIDFGFIFIDSEDPGYAGRDDGIRGRLDRGSGS